MTVLPAPGDFFGRVPLGDDVIIRWAEMLAYFERLASLNRRLTVREIGRDWSGRPLISLSIGGAEPTPDRPAIVVTAGIHATELGGAQLMPILVFELLTAPPRDLQAAFERLDVVIVPCLNPGGLEIVADWREQARGRPYHGSEPPGPTHPIGHDLNRDWIMLTQKETRAVAVEVFNRCRPLVVLDLHEMPSNGPRYALPPYLDPIDPNVPPAIVRCAEHLGHAIAAQMANEGKTGVTTGLFFDAFSPARAYPLYHGSVRILAEAAGTRLGLPVHLSADELASAPGFNPREPSADHPQPWQGGRWSLSDVADYHRTAVLSAIAATAQLPAEATDPSARRAFIIPPIPLQRDPGAARQLLETLEHGGVALNQSTEPFQVGDVQFPTDSVIVQSDQTAWPWANALLSVQHYPAPDGENAPPPYDVTAQTLPLLMGVDVIKTDQRVQPASSPYVHRASARRPEWRSSSVAVYSSVRPDATEAGWAMTMLSDAGIEMTKLSDARIRSGDLDRLDVIVLPHQRPEHLLDGLNLAHYPAQFTGGIGRVGIGRLKQWVRRGGRLVAIDGASRAIIDAMHLPIIAIADGFYAPGSILRVELDTKHPIAAGIEPELAIMSRTSVAYDLDHAPTPDARAIARYPLEDPLLSGWLSGWERLAGQAAIVELRIGAGAVLLFGCRPLFRGQTLASRRLIANVIRNARKRAPQ